MGATFFSSYCHPTLSLITSTFFFLNFFSSFSFPFPLSMPFHITTKRPKKATKGITPIWSIFFPPFFSFPCPSLLQRNGFCPKTWRRVPRQTGVSVWVGMPTDARLPATPPRRNPKIKGNERQERSSGHLLSFIHVCNYLQSQRPQFLFSNPPPLHHVFPFNETN